MITEELKHTLDSLPSEIHEQARELVKTWKTANDRIIQIPTVLYSTKIQKPHQTIRRRYAQ